MAGPSNPFDMGKMAMGGFGQMFDSVDFVKRAWSTLNLPSTMVPTVDVEELDKRIADLKAVEQWLNLNLSMLRGTIQGLEIQRGTLAAVKAFGASMGNIGMPGAGAAQPTPARERPAPRPAPMRAEPPEPPPQPPREAPAPPEAAPASGAPDAAADGPMAGIAGINPGAWWNLLQQNFNQVAEAAMSGVGLQGAALKAAADAAVRTRDAVVPAMAAAAAGAMPPTAGARTPAATSGAKTAASKKPRTAAAAKRAAAPRRPAAPRPPRTPS